MQEIVEAAKREQLGQQMVCDLLDIAQLTGQPIKHMFLNSKGVFEETTNKNAWQTYPIICKNDPN